jgi:hypothetical protein
VTEDVWNAVKARLAAVSAHYTKTKDGKPKGRSVPGRSTRYLFSSLLYCGECGSKMVASGGSSATYFRCEGHSRRGICKNALSVREDVARTSLLDELRHRLTSENGLARAQKRLAQRLGELAREQGGELREQRARVDKAERDIAKLLEFVTAGHGTKAVSDKLKVLEREAEEGRRALAGLERADASPVKLPSPDEMFEIAFDLERRLMADVTRGREELRRVFRDGRINLVPQPGGFYIARSEILPLVLLTKPPPEETPGGWNEVSRYSASSCAGRI